LSGLGLSYTFFKVQDKIQGIRVSRDEEMIGLDIPEMGAPAYPASPHL
jgi:ammonium transporter, Amt family